MDRRKERDCVGREREQRGRVRGKEREREGEILRV